MPSSTPILLTFVHQSDLVEVSLSDLTITRIALYLNLTSVVKELEFDDCSPSLKDAILNAVVNHLRKNHHVQETRPDTSRSD